MKEVRLNRQVYEKDAIAASVEMFQKICSIRIVEEDEYYIIVIDRSIAEESLTAKEFCNMALMETIRRKHCLHV